MRSKNVSSANKYIKQKKRLWSFFGLFSGRFSGVFQGFGNKSVQLSLFWGNIAAHSCGSFWLLDGVRLGFQRIQPSFVWLAFDEITKRGFVDEVFGAVNAIELSKTRLFKVNWLWQEFFSVVRDQVSVNLKQCDEMIELATLWKHKFRRLGAYLVQIFGSTFGPPSFLDMCVAGVILFPLIRARHFDDDSIALFEVCTFALHTRLLCLLRGSKVRSSC